MKKSTKSAGAQPADSAVLRPVALKERFDLHNFTYLPGREHQVDGVTYEAMKKAGVLDNGVEVS